MAQQIIAETPRIHRTFVFPARGRDRPASGFSSWKRKLDHDCCVADWTLHDIRRTVATKLAKLKVPIEVTETILNHRSGKLSGVAGIYNRHDYFDDCGEALRLWQGHLELLLSHE